MSRPRSIAEVLRAQSPESLADLVRLRPDLAQPRPHDLAELVERATGSASTQLAIEGLTAWQRRVCLGLAATEDAISTRSLAALLQAERPAVQQALTDLARRALVWGSERAWHLTRAARAAFGPYPGGLAPASAMPLDDATIDAKLAEVGEAGRAVLERLLWENPTGRVSQADRRGSADSTRPVDQLLHHRLVRPLDAETVVLPREVALRLREGRLFADQVASQVPAWPAPEPSTSSDRAGEGSAFEAVQQTEALVEALGDLQPRPLATGAIGRRDFATLAGRVGDPERALLLLMVAEQTGLVASAGSAWLPSTGYDQWLALPAWPRWQALRDGWLALAAWSDLQAPVLAPGNQVSWAAEVRSLALRQLQAAAPGTPVQADRLAERLAWLRPSWVRLDLPWLAGQLVAEATVLGLVALGRRTALVDALDDPGFPSPVSGFVIQSDLTAVAPGPLQHEVAQAMSLLAERESTGGAGVHRFTASSLRRGLDAGWTADEIRDWLAEHSETGVPQALDYLVDDVARRHGQVQVATAAAVVSVDDPAVAEALAARPGASALGLRRLSSTVLAAAADPAEVVDFLRAAGLAPIAQDEQGRRRTAPPPRRSRALLATARPVVERAAGIGAVEALVAELLARDDDRRNLRAQADIVETLRAQVGEPGWWLLDFVAADGTPRNATVRVMALSAGSARLMEKASGPITLPLARMIGLRRLP